MKTTNKSNQIQGPELDAYVYEKLTEISQHIKVNAEGYAARNMPPLTAEATATYFHEDHLKYQALIDTVGIRIPVRSTCDEVAEHGKSTDTHLKGLHNRLVSAKENRIAIEAMLKNRPRQFSKVRPLLVWLAIGTITSFEGLLAIPVFETWGYSLAEASVMGLLFAGVLAVFAHTFGRIVMLGKAVWQRRAIAAAILLLLAGLFGYMSQVRAEYLSAQLEQGSSDGLHIHFSALPFVLTSMLLFVVAVAVNRFFFPTRQQRNAMSEYNKLQQERSRNEEEQRQMSREEREMEDAHANLRRENAYALEYGYGLEQLIISHAHSGYALWKKHNLMHRPDNGHPQSFGNPDYPFDFNTHFHFIKLL